MISFSFEKKRKREILRMCLSVIMPVSTVSVTVVVWTMKYGSVIFLLASLWNSFTSMHRFTLHMTNPELSNSSWTFATLILPLLPFSTVREVWHLNPNTHARIYILSNLVSLHLVCSSTTNCSLREKNKRNKNTAMMRARVCVYTNVIRLLLILPY